MANARRKEYVAPLQVVVTRRVKDKIQRIAKRENVSMAEVIRGLIEGNESLDEREARSKTGTR